MVTYPRIFAFIVLTVIAILYLPLLSKAHLFSRRNLLEKTSYDIFTCGVANAAMPTNPVSHSAMTTSYLQRPGIFWHAAKRQALPAIPETLRNLIHTEWLAHKQSSSLPPTSGIVCISERHDDFQHHIIQLRILQSLSSALRKDFVTTPPFAVGMECFERSDQCFLDKFIGNPSYTLNSLNRDCKWDTSWGYDMLHYAPILTFCKSKRIRVFGVHPSQQMVEAVRRNGLHAVPSSVLCGVTTNEPGHYKQFQRIMAYQSDQAGTRESEVRKAHFNRLYEIQCFREEYMAESVSLEFHKNRGKFGGGYWVVVLAGENHIVGRGGIPFRALRRTTKRTRNDLNLRGSQNRGLYTIMPQTVKFPVVTSDAPDRLAADYVWFVEHDPQLHFDADIVNASPFRHHDCTVDCKISG